MEHRLSGRIPLLQQAVIDCPRMGRNLAKIRNIGLSGAVVESSLYLPLYTLLTVSFSLENSGERHDFRFEAMVVRHTPTGAGLLFSDLETRELQRLHAALHPPVPAQQPHYKMSEPTADQPSVAAMH